MRGALLDAFVEWFTAKGLVNAADYGRQFVANFDTKQICGLFLLLQTLSEPAYGFGDLVVIERFARASADILDFQFLIIILHEHKPRVGIVSDDLEEFALVSLGAFGLQCLLNKFMRGFQFTKFSGLTFQKAFFIDSIALEDVVPQSSCCPNAELGRPLGVDPVTNGNDSVEVVVFILVNLAIWGNLCKKCTS